MSTEADNELVLAETQYWSAVADFKRTGSNDHLHAMWAAFDHWNDVARKAPSFWVKWPKVSASAKELEREKARACLRVFKGEA